MSKPIARVVFAVLISLVIIAAAASPVVQSSLGSVLRRAGINSAIISVPVDNQNLRQGTMNEQIPAPPQYNDFAPDSSHECNSDPSLDY